MVVIVLHGHGHSHSAVSMIASQYFW